MWALTYLGYLGDHVFSRRAYDSSGGARCCKTIIISVIDSWKRYLQKDRFRYRARSYRNAYARLFVLFVIA